MAVGLERPVDGFGAEGYGGVFLEEGVDGPGLITEPGFYGGGEDEGHGCPALVEVIGAEVGEARDEVVGRDGGGVF